MNAIIIAAALLAAPATPEQAVATLWRSLSHDAGQAGNEAALRAILHPDAMVYGARYRGGAAALSVRAAPISRQASGASTKKVSMNARWRARYASTTVSHRLQRS